MANTIAAENDKIRIQRFSISAHSTTASSGGISN